MRRHWFQGAIVTAVVLSIAGGSTSHAAPVLDRLAPVVPLGEDASSAIVVMDDAGRVTVAYNREATGTIEWIGQTPGLGRWSTPQAFVGAAGRPGDHFRTFRLVGSGSGHLLAVWDLPDESLVAAVRPAGSTTFGPAVRIAPPGSDVSSVSADISESGQGVVAMGTTPGSLATEVRVAFLAASTTSVDPLLVPAAASGATSSPVDVAIDDRGRTVVLFGTRTASTHTINQVRGSAGGGTWQATAVSTIPVDAAWDSVGVRVDASGSGRLAAGWGGCPAGCGSDNPSFYAFGSTTAGLGPATATASEVLPEVEFDRAGNALVTWVDGTLRMARASWSVSTFGSPFEVTTSTAPYGHVVDFAGNTLLASMVVGGRIQAIEVTDPDASSTWPAPVPISGTLGELETDNDLSDRGGLAMVWASVELGPGGTQPVSRLHARTTNADRAGPVLGLPPVGATLRPNAALRKVVASISCPTGEVRCTGIAQLRTGPSFRTLLGTASFSIPGASRRGVAITLTPTGRARLGGRGTVTLRVRSRDASANRSNVSRVVRLAAR